MSIKLQLILLIGVIIYLGIIFFMLRRHKLNLKYSLVWFFTALIMIVITVFPGIVTFFANLIGITTPVNLIFVIEGLFVLLIILSLTTIVSLQTYRIRRLTQSIALLDQRLRQLEKTKYDDKL